MSDHDIASPAARGRYIEPRERVYDKIVTPLDEFIHNQTSGGIALMFATVVALIIANSPLAEAYQRLLHTPVTLGVGTWVIDMGLHHWINDGLMVLFFFLVGLEIKREILVGELASPRQADLPNVAAVGGKVVTALVYWSI